MMQTLQTAKTKPALIHPSYIVHVTHEDNMWIAECDALGLVTEANTYDQLTERVWAVAPDLLEANQEPIDMDTMVLTFQHIDVAANHRAVN